MVAKPENEPDAAISSTVERLYDTYPFPPETLLDEAPLGYNWRWHYPSVHAFCTGTSPQPRSSDEPLRILDAGCGTGESTTFLVHQNPDAQVTAIDLSNGALQVARERLARSLPDEQNRVSYHHLSIFDVAGLDDGGVLYDYINCVGVVHHTPDPGRALRALAGKLKPGGLLHVFVYGAHGRWEISLMQRALRLLLAGEQQEFEKGVEVGRAVFEALPDGNRLKKREADRWAQDNLKDATFADMYLHPQEIDYDVDSLFELIKESGLKFVDFSNPRTWDVSRLLGSDERLMKLAEGIRSDMDRYKLVELLDPEAITHFEFFLAKDPAPPKNVWDDDATLNAASANMSTCTFGWPGKVIMDRDYYPVQLSEDQESFLKAVNDNPGITVADACASGDVALDAVRQLVKQGIVLLSSP